jgi:hypothetical protein
MLAFPKKTEDAVRGHVYLTILTFNLTNAYRTEEGQALAEQGIRRQRLVWHDPNKVLVIAGECYAILGEPRTWKNCSSCWAVNLSSVGA